MLTIYITTLVLFGNISPILFSCELMMISKAQLKQNVAKITKQKQNIGKNGNHKPNTVEPQMIDKTTTFTVTRAFFLHFYLLLCSFRAFI